MKKLLSMLLCLLLLTALLTACGNDTKKQKDKEKDEKPRPSISDKVPEDDTACVTIDAYGNVELALNLPKIAWGNQITISNRHYGLDKITLYPARLNTNSGALVNRQSPLKFPKYGADGRVAEMSADTLVGAYDSVSGGFVYTPGAGNKSVGVSGVGKTASMSKRAFAIMNGKSAIASNKAAAANAAKDAIRLYGGKLAAIALQYDNAGTDEVVAEADIAVLKDLIATLEGSANNISESMKAAVLVVLAAEESLNDDQWAIAAGLADGKDIVEYLAALQTDYSSVSFPDEVTTIVADYEAIVAKLDAASAALPESGDGTWGAIESSVRNLLVASGIRIGGYTISEIKTDYSANGMGGDVVKDLFNKVSDGSLTFAFTDGIFVDIADMTGNYTSSMAFPEGTEVAGLDLNMLGSKPLVVEGDNGSVGSLGALAEVSVIKDAQAPTTDPNADIPLTDTFGYIVDLLFRTNATESDLLLQTAPANRYAEGAVDETMDGGSNMTFTVNDEYSVERIEVVAAGIRVVFFDQNGAFLAVAVLDTDNGTLSDDAYVINLYLHDFTIDDEGVLSIGDRKTDNKIRPLSTNMNTAVSALVYLDGDVIDNSHAGMLIGLEAMLNLQFASSVELKPIEDSDLMGE